MGSKIMFINPFSWTRDGRPGYLPYGVLSICGYLKKRGIASSVFDCNVDASDPIDKVKELKPDYVGLSVLSGSVIAEAIKITRGLRKLSKEVKIIWGGLHPTLFPSYVADDKSIDYIVKGEGEEAMLDILNDKAERVVDFKPFVNLDRFWPDWEAVDVKKYISNRIWASRVLTMNTSRGCIFRCAFCFNQGIPSQRWRGSSAGTIADQVVYLKERYGINGIQFYEDCFDADKKRVVDFCSLIKPHRIRWSHFSSVPLVDEDLLKIERQAGCRYIEYGVESGSERILKFINKRQTVNQIRSAFQKCKRVGIKAAALFMIGLPTETTKDLNATVKLIDSLPSQIPICTIYRPYPSTPLYDWSVKNKGFIEPKNLEEQAEFYNYGGLADDKVNVSDVPTKELTKIKMMFYRKLIIKEIITCLVELNFSRIFYHMRRLWKH